MGARKLTADRLVERWITERLGPVVGGVPAGPFRDDVDKLVAAMPKADRVEVANAVARILVSPLKPGETFEPPGEVRPDVFREVTRAFAKQRAIAIVYGAADGTRTERRVEPHGILIRAPLWYVLAFDLGREAPRTFRLDRIEAASPVLAPRFPALDPREMFDNLEGLSLRG